MPTLLSMRALPRSKPKHSWRQYIMTWLQVFKTQSIEPDALIVHSPTFTEILRRPKYGRCKVGGYFINSCHDWLSPSSRRDKDYDVPVPRTCPRVGQVLPKEESQWSQYFATTPPTLTPTKVLSIRATEDYLANAEAWKADVSQLCKNKWRST